MRILLLLLVTLVSQVAASHHELASILSVHPEPHYANIESVITSQPFTTNEIRHLETLHSFTLSTGGRHGDVSSHPFRSSSRHEIVQAAQHTNINIAGYEIPHGEALHIAFNALGESFDYHLTPMYGLLNADSIVEIHGSNGLIEKQKMKLQSYYLHMDDEWVSLTVHSDGTFSSIIRRNGEVYQVDPVHAHYESMQSEHHYNTLSASAPHGMTIFKHSDILSEGSNIGGKEHTCGSISREGVEAHARGETIKEQHVHKHARHLLAPDLFNCGQPVGASGFAAISLGQVVDYGMYLRAGSPQANPAQATTQKAIEYVQSVYAMMNSVYAPQLKMFLQVATTQIETQPGFGAQNEKRWNVQPAVPGLRCDSANGGTVNPANPNGAKVITQIQTTLTDFSTYVRTQKAGQMTLWHHMTNCYPPGGVIGIAYVGTMCTTLRTGVSTFSTTTWLTMAHEIGHNFGADHTFQLGQGKTGGIMDYGDGRYKGEFQFNIIYSKQDFCGGILGIAAIPGGARNAPIAPFCFQPLAALPQANPAIPGQPNPPVTPGTNAPVTQRPTIPPPPPVVTQRPPVTTRPVATLPPVVTQRPPVVPVTPRPVPTQPPATAPPPRRPPPDGNIYKWAYTPWSACSATCEGTRTRQVVCVNANNLANLLVVPPQMCIDYATNGPQPISQEACGGNCPVKFVAKPGAQGVCTSASGATCAAAGVGQQAATATGTISQPVQCVKTINGRDQVVADQVCINQGVAKPATDNVKCNLPTCPGQYTWAYTRWLACSKECDGGLQSRIVACIRVDAQGNIAFATDANGQRTTAQCDTLPETKPVTQQACNTQPCMNSAQRYVWTITSEFGPCTAPCAGGLQTRTAYCTDKQTNQIIPNNQCPNMPILERPCNTQACGVYVWNIGQPGPCNGTCGDDVYYTRTITCINSNDRNKVPVTNTSLCLASERPSDTVKCATQACPTTPVTPTTRPVTPTNPPVTPPAASSFTAAQVATHNTRTDCWTIIGTDVYDITRLVPTHPGGVATIVASCGKVADSAVQDNHGNPTNVIAKMAPLKKGKLTTSTATYTAELVATHGSMADCWSIIDGKVYNLSYYGQDTDVAPDAHPGGASVILAGCGKDISKQFAQYHVAADILTLAEIKPRLIGQIGTGGATVPSTQFPPPIGTQQYSWYIDTVQVACGAAPTYQCTVVNTSPARCVVVNGAKLTGIDSQYCANQPDPTTDPRQPRAGQPCIVDANNANPCARGRTGAGAVHHALSAVGSRGINNVHPLHRRSVHVLATGTGTGPQWLAGPFGTCTRMCDSGTQVRNVTCVDGQTGAKLALEQCDAATKPAETSECGMMACNAFWATSEWNECSEACGGLGNQTRTVQCRSSASPDGLGVVVADSECAMVASKPSESQQCNAQPCPKWEGKQWSECSVPCGAGHKTLLDAKCVNQYGIVLPDSECVTKSQFNAMVPCNNGPCPVYDHLPWEPCSQTCGGGIQNRTVYCRTQNKGDITGRIEYNMTICDMYDGDGRKQGNHVTSQTCNEQACGALYWKILERGTCSKQCGGGARRVTSVCMQQQTDKSYQQVADSVCINGALIQRPLEIENCNEQPCAVEYGWAPGAWGPCSAFCGTGTQTREVNCINLITKELTPGKCPPSSQFSTTQPCTEKVEKCYGNVRIGDDKNGECITDATNPKKGTCNCRPGFAGSDCTIEPAITAVFFENTRYAAGVPVGANEKVIIRWNSLGSSEQVSLILVRDDPKSFFTQYIARSVINSGVYEWNVGATLDDLPFADNYVVRVVTKNTVYGQTARFSTADKCQYVSCGTNALCQAGKCICQPGYSGPQCQITPCMKAGCDVDRSTCDNTIANPTCICNNGWTGPQCRTPKVCALKCENGDLAIPEDMPIAGVAECPLADADLTCQCKGQWSGKTCNTCGLQCMNGGTPDTTCSACVCKPGWTGPTCGCRYYDIKATLNYDTTAWDRSAKPYSASTRRFQQTFANDVAASIPGFNANQIQFTTFSPADKQINIGFQFIELCSSTSADLLMNDMIRINGVHIAFDSISNTMDQLYPLFLQQLRNKESTLLTGVVASSIADGSVNVVDPLAVNGAQPEQPGKPTDPFGTSPVNAGIYESKSSVNMMLIGIIIGAVVGVILAVLAVIYFMRARKSSTRTLNKVTTEQMPTSPQSASTTPRSTAFTAEGQPNGVMPMQQRVQHVYGA